MLLLGASPKRPDRMQQHLARELGVSMRLQLLVELPEDERNPLPLEAFPSLRGASALEDRANVGESPQRRERTQLEGAQDRVLRVTDPQRAHRLQLGHIVAEHVSRVGDQTLPDGGQYRLAAIDLSERGDTSRSLECLTGAVRAER